MEEIGLGRDRIGAIDPDPVAPLLTQGIDSMNFLVLAAAVEKKFGADISDISAAKLRPLNDFVRFIHEKGGDIGWPHGFHPTGEPEKGAHGVALREGSN
ncbi:MAG: acyl carrier protein [Geobacteraceae bacterium]|nr:acyl carrier protein [Geobacteraceae bacterium]